MQFNNKIVIITGGNSGIGKATALKFAEQGAKILIADLGENLHKDLKNIKHIAYKKTDVTKYSDVEAMFEEAIKQFGDFDILLNSAGIEGERFKTEKYPNEMFQKVMEINVTGLFYCMKVALQHFSAKKSGNIVNIASIAGHLGMSGHISYSASKHAVMGMTKTAAVEYAKTGIRINAVCPGFTDTPMLQRGMETDPNRMEAFQQAIPMKRYGKPEEIADAILYLASDASSFITGQGIILDGGLILQ
jgi:3-oxoacyl-[acyl-carrier protein] reductase